jgi:wyosine [tRNA(Phe)-imidazoG37] synthetase (radical SAM superfamily)
MVGGLSRANTTIFLGMENQLLTKSAAPGIQTRRLLSQPLAEPPLPIPDRSRRYFGNKVVYAVISQRAHGLSIGINLNPDRFCNFDCLYCEINRDHVEDVGVDLQVLREELCEMLARVEAETINRLPGYQNVPADLLHLREVALSGDGEPTLCPNFDEVVETIMHLRAKRLFPFFKVVLITNTSGLHLPRVQSGLKLFTAKDELWLKLDAGTQAYFEKMNRPKSTPVNWPTLSLEGVLKNILTIARQRPVIIQSLFAALDGTGPDSHEIEAYVTHLKELKQAGAQISLVQIYSAHRPAANPACRHLPLRTLSEITKKVRAVTGLPAEVF